MSKYHQVSPEQWPNTPITIEINPVTGRDDGDDKGYRQRPTLEGNFERLVEPAGLPTRPVYDGKTEYGTDHNELLPGGVEGGKLVVRETVARMLDEANRALQEAFADEHQLAALDGFRSGERQKAGWDRLRQKLLAEAGIKDVNEPSVANLYTFGLASDDTFAFVNPDTNSPEYQALADELKADKVFMEELRAAAREDDDDPIFNYIAISANAGKGRAVGRNIPLIANPMAHNSGAAIDAMLIGRDGTLRSHIPFDFPGEIARMDFLERPDAFEVYTTALRDNQGLRAHVKEIGLDPDNLTEGQFNKMRMDQRVLRALMDAVGATMYVGETWHFNGGINPTTIDGKPLIPNNVYADKANIWGSNTCDAQLRLGSAGTAAFGGRTAEAVARRDWGLKA